MPGVRPNAWWPECITEEKPHLIEATEQRNNVEAKDRCASSDILPSIRPAMNHECVSP